MSKPLYTLIVFCEGSEHLSIATTDKKRARKTYWRYNIRYGYPPRVYVNAARLNTHEADALFKFDYHGSEHKALFEKGALAKA